MKYIDDWIEEVVYSSYIVGNGRTSIRARLPEWSKGVDSSPTVRSTRGFKSHSVHFSFFLWFFIQTNTPFNFDSIVFPPTTDSLATTKRSLQKLHCNEFEECPEWPTTKKRALGIAKTNSAGICKSRTSIRFELQSPCSSLRPSSFSLPVMRAGQTLLAARRN